MKQEVFSIELPVGERFVINKNRIEGKRPRAKRLAIVTGIHDGGCWKDRIFLLER